MRKLKVFGLDGADYFIIKKNLDKLPHWREIKERFPITLMWTDIEDSRRPWKFDSAMLWTSIFTGKRPEEHGVWGYKEGIDGRMMARQDVKAQFIWEQAGAKFLVWHIPALIPPLSWRCSGADADKLVWGLDEWCDGVKRFLGSGVDFDVFISVFCGSDEFQHRNWGNMPTILQFYDKIAECLLTHLWGEDDVLIISDHGFTDIDTAVEHMWTWKYSKTVNMDVGHHAPWGICATNLKWRPFKVSDIYKAIARHLIAQGYPIKLEW